MVAISSEYFREQIPKCLEGFFERDPFVVRWLIRANYNREDVLECFNDVCLRLVSVGTKKSTSKDGTIPNMELYLMRLTRKRLKTRLKKKKELLFDDIKLDCGNVANENCINGEDVFLIKDVVRRGLSVMPKSFKNILDLRYYEEETPGEIAKSLDVPDGTVKSRTHWAIKLLKEKVEEKLK